jgi:hypothetical protein
VHGLGLPGATDAQVAAAESRLGVNLPPSYSEFLKATNGLLQPYSYVASYGGDFWPVAEIDWFPMRNSEWIEAYAGVDEDSDRPPHSPRSAVSGSTRAARRAGKYAAAVATIANVRATPA